MGLLNQGPGQFFLFAGVVLLVFVSVSAPVATWLYFLKAEAGGIEIRFGNWGYCIRTGDGGDWNCSDKSLGYDADNVVDIISSTGDVSGAIIRGLTFSMILHPIAAAISLLAMLVALTTNVCLDICGSLIAFFAFLVCLVALICDSVLFVTARHRINDNLPGSPASLSNCYWMVVAATVSLFIASLTVCLGSASARRQKRARESAAYSAAPAPVMYEKRHWWNRNKY